MEKIDPTRPVDSAGAGSIAQPEIWLDEYGDHLYGYAYFRVRNHQIAEDLVQETFLSAIRGFGKFEGRSAVKTWLTAILRNKIVDHLRKSKREIVVEEIFPTSDSEGEYLASGMVNPAMGAGEWAVKPDDAMSKSEFWASFQRCVGGLPQEAADVFLSREIDGATTDEICASRGLTKSNVWVILHRARKALRKCLENGWFQKQ